VEGLSEILRSRAGSSRRYVACRTATFFLDWTSRVNGAWFGEMIDVSKTARTVTSDGIAAEIDRMSGLDLSAVRVLWRTHFRRRAPKALSRDLLLRMLAWRIQEQAFGGHDAATLRLLNSYGRKNGHKVVLYRKLRPGASVVREYRGVRHVVTVSESGFVWQDRTYGSLSAIAREITGSRWNGPRFFGLRAGDEAAVRARKTS